jgi:hypothetical protein
MNLDVIRWPRVLWLAGVLILSGCSIVSVDQRTRYRDAEGYFDVSMLEQIKVGETSHSWVVAHFGRPWYREVEALTGYPEDVQINTWRFEREQQKNTRVLVLFRSRKLEQQFEYLHVVSEGDKVMRAWRDAAVTVDAPRLMAAMGYAKKAVVEERQVVPTEEVETPSPVAPVENPAVQSVPAPASLSVEDVVAPAPKPASAAAS